MQGIWQYHQWLPQVGEENRFTLGEGNTPLIPSRSIGRMLGLEHLYFKLEMLNPSGSYKDRFAACVVSELQQREVPFCIATSSGNTGAALAAYCAAAGIKCYMVVTDGAPAGKLQQMQVYGAETLMVRGFGLDPGVSARVMEGLSAICSKAGTAVQISAYQFSPGAMEGVQTIAYEIAGQLPATNAQVFSPAGGGGLTLAVGKGFSTYAAAFPDFKIPRLHCVQPVGNNTIAGALRRGASAAQAVSRSTTTISGLQVPHIIDGDAVVQVCRQSGGTGYEVLDETVLDCQEKLAKMEGIFCEPAGAVALAGVVQALEKKELRAGDPVVCLVTGHGFKEPVSAAAIAGRTDAASFDQVADVFGYIESRIKD